MMELLSAGLVVMSTLSFAESQVFPASISFTDGVSVNGSSATGNCSSVTNSSGTITCTDPTSSVLYDGHIPTLTGLDGDMWASQLHVLTLHTTTHTINITFDFSATSKFTRVERVEVVMFNCPEWGMGIQTVIVIAQGRAIKTITPTITSCDALGQMCLSVRTEMSQLTLEFILSPNSHWVHLAEVTFYETGNTCPPDTIITPPAPPTTSAPDTSITTTPPPTTPPTTVTPAPPNLTTSDGDTPTTDTPTSQPNPDPTTPPFCSTQCEECPSCSTSTLLASVLTAITTALLATAIFLLVQVAVCKCHPNFTPGGAETGTSAGEGEEQEYEQMNACEGGVATRNPIYMEVDAEPELKQYEVYATCT